MNSIFIFFSLSMIAALSIGLSVLTFTLCSFLYFTLYTKRSPFKKGNLFEFKKWMYIAFVFAFNVAMCTLVYYLQSVKVILYIIVALKSKDLISSVMFLPAMIYKYIYNTYNTKISEGIKNIVAFVPVYNESLDQLSRTVDSILQNDVNSNYLLTCVVSDGGNGYSKIIENVSSSMNGLYYTNWKGDLVFVNIYFGTRKLRHIVLIEKHTNCGKKDSIILANNIFNKTNSSNFIKNEVLSHLFSVFGVNEFDCMFTTDADTVLDNNTIVSLLSNMDSNNAMASCGIVRVDKSNGNWFWNNLQDFQYVYGQYMRRSIEDLCNQVLCLPGCVSLYRLNEKTMYGQFLYSEIPNTNNLVVSNVQYVGTDRRFTGSLIYTNPGVKINMDTRCNAYTVPPQSINSYLSQRRRWCQNTYFNTMINIIAPNVNPLLRFFCLIDYLRLSLVYFRIFNTLFFVYLLASQTNSRNILEFLPFIVILSYPVFIFFVFGLFEYKLRKSWFNLLFYYLINKVFIVFSNILVFTSMLLNIGSNSWSTIKNTQQRQEQQNP